MDQTLTASHRCKVIHKVLAHSVSHERLATHSFLDADLASTNVCVDTDKSDSSCCQGGMVARFVVKIESYLFNIGMY